MLFFQLSEAFQAVCISTLRTDLIFRIDIISFVLLLFFLLLSTQYPFSILYVSAATAAIAGFKLLAYLFLFRRYFPSCKDFMNTTYNLRSIFSRSRDLVLLSSPYVLTVGLLIINLKADAVIVGYMLPVSDLPSYSIASKVMLFMQAAFIPYESIMSRKNILQGVDELSLFKSIRKVYAISFYLSLLLAFFMLLASPLLINFLYGANFSSAVLPLSILCFVPAFASLMRGQAQINLVRRNNKSLVFRQVVAVCCNLLLDFLLIPKLGLNGAAIATLASVILAIMATFFVDKKIFYIVKSIILEPDFSFFKGLWRRY